jgi:cytochrome c biogenesis protein CcmG, thiol:disulfide interchange protein DsbE
VKHPTRWIALAVAVVVIAVGVVLATQVGGDPRADATHSQLVGERAPRFSVRPLDGGSLSRQDLLGKAVIVNFWNSWCVPCQDELPALHHFADLHRDDPDVELVGIVRDDTKDAVRAYVAAEGVDWKIAMDPGARAALAYGTRGQPETFAITPSGYIAGAQIGPTTADDLETMLAAARGRAR